MAKVLYIQASPRKERSKSSQVAVSFLESYQKLHPGDTVETFNVFEQHLPNFDGFAVKAKYSIMHGKDHTEQERQAWNAIEKMIDHFKDADKYLFSLPMWNFGIPYRLKQYVDILVQPGYTFSADENGYEGLVKNKPALLIYARGGAYPEGADVDLQKKYMELILGFMGFQNIRSIVVEPTLHGNPEEIQRMLEESIRKVHLLAEKF